MALATMWYVVWSTARAADRIPWEDAFVAHWDKAIRGSSALRAAIMRRMRDEVAVLSGQEALCILWDLAKFFETICLDKLAARCKHLGFPAQIASVCLNMYRGPRFLTLGRMVQGPFYAMRGVIAGCSTATSFVRAFIIPSLDLLSPQGAERVRCVH